MSRVRAGQFAVRAMPGFVAFGVAVGLLTLSGCVQDTASYLIADDNKHAITLVRSQQWFWDDRVTLAVMAARQPDCLGGLDIKGVSRDAEIVLSQAPDDYAEPIFILTVGPDHYAVSTISCRVQKFDTAPTETGLRLGVFREQAGRLRFVAEAAST